MRVVLKVTDTGLATQEASKDAWQGLGYRCRAENGTCKKDMSLRLRGKG